MTRRKKYRSYGNKNKEYQNIKSQFTQSNPYLNPNSYENNYNIDETKFENRKNKKKVRFSDQVKKTPTKSCENNDSEYDEKYSYQFTGMNDKEYDSENSTNWENIHKSGIPKNRNIYQDDEDKFEKIYVRNNKGDFVLLKQGTKKLKSILKNDKSSLLNSSRDNTNNPTYQNSTTEFEDSENIKNYKFYDFNEDIEENPKNMKESKIHDKNYTIQSTKMTTNSNFNQLQDDPLDFKHDIQGNAAVCQIESNPFNKKIFRKFSRISQARTDLRKNLKARHLHRLPINIFGPDKESNIDEKVYPLSSAFVKTLKFIPNTQNASNNFINEASSPVLYNSCIKKSLLYFEQSSPENILTIQRMFNELTFMKNENYIKDERTAWQSAKLSNRELFYSLQANWIKNNRS